MNRNSDAPRSPLALSLGQLVKQVLDTRDSLAPVKPGEITAAEVYDAADRVQQINSFRP